MAAKGPGLWTVLQAHLRASPAKSAVLGVLTLALLILVVSQFSGGPKSADAAPSPAPAIMDYAPAPEQPTQVTPVALPTVPKPPMATRVVRNPFAVDLELFEPMPGTEPTTTEPDPVVQNVDPVARAFSELTLQSTVSGPRPMATVNGVVVRVGDRVYGFSVRRIGVRVVTLAHGDRQFELRMD